MLELLILAAVAAPSNAVPAVGGLEGCWKAPGQVRGTDATSIARGEWHLGGRYFILHLKAVAKKDPYEASLLYGAGEKPDSINAYWMDTFGGAYSTSGKGAATGDGFDVVYAYPDSVYTNRFTRAGKGWRWTIMEQASGKPEKLFAEYRLTPTACRGMKFDF
ncbi:MAG TPA: hypothetical protein VFW35_13375 [Sphingomicrobium sp.]|nr:hypothetical protein [Sphingomicrobium sp.]